MSDTTEQQILQLNQRLLDSIATGDWPTYRELCHPELTCFEPETEGQLVSGLGFHQYFFDLGPPGSPRHTVMASPRVWLLGADAAVVAYVRLTQKLTANGEPVTAAAEETRVWQRIDGAWRHVHFHRSTLK